MDLLIALTAELDKAAPQLRALGRDRRTSRTEVVRQAIVNLAPGYVEGTGIGFGHNSPKPGRGAPDPVYSRDRWQSER
jgi:hypothetical protein